MLPALVEKAATTATATAAAAAAARAAPISCSASVPKLSAPVLSGRSGIARNGLDAPLPELRGQRARVPDLDR